MRKCICKFVFQHMNEAELLLVAKFIVFVMDRLKEREEYQIKNKDK